MAYAASHGHHCPNCEHDTFDVLEGLRHNYDFPDYVNKDLRCQNCGSTWREVYDLKGYADLNIPRHHPTYVEAMKRVRDLAEDLRSKGFLVEQSGDTTLSISVRPSKD